MDVRFAMYDPDAHEGIVEFERSVDAADADAVIAALRGWDSLAERAIGPERLEAVFEPGLTDRGSVFARMDSGPRQRVGYFHLLGLTGDRRTRAAEMAEV